MPPPRRPSAPISPDVLEARRVLEGFERQIILGAANSYFFYQYIKPSVCPYDPATLSHRQDFNTGRYNSLWALIAAFYYRFEHLTLEKDINIPVPVLKNLIADSCNKNRIAIDLAEQLTEEVTSEEAFTASLTYDSSMALAQSPAFADWLQSRITEQTFGLIGLHRSLGSLTLGTLDEIVSKAKTAGGQVGLAKRIADRAYRTDVEIPPPLVRYAVGDTAVSTPGNLTTISGQSKVGKTAIVTAMIAGTFAAEGADCLGFKSSNPDGLSVIYVDTEQSTYDHQELLKLTARRAGQTLPPWTKSFCLTGFTPTDIRQAVPVLLDQAQLEFGGVHSLILDGVADIANDVNDQAESNAIVAELHALAIKFDCAIVLCIHQNPGKDPKMRGHLGSQAERKAESNLRVEKDADEVSVLWADKNRRSPIFKKNGPRFAWNHDHKMHRQVESQKQAKLTYTNEQLRKTFAPALDGHQAMTHTKLKKAIIDRERFSESTAERRITEAITTGIIQKNPFNHYVLSI